MKYYCVCISKVTYSPWDNVPVHEDEEVRFFNDFHKADLFRKWSIRMGKKYVSNVIDMDNIPF